jgi:hypothetical protein
VTHTMFILVLANRAGILEDLSDSIGILNCMEALNGVLGCMRDQGRRRARDSRLET